MIDTIFKFVLFKGKFQHEGQKYTKTNHSRGFYYENGNIVHRVFKNTTKVRSEKCFFDVETGRK